MVTLRIMTERSHWSFFTATFSTTSSVVIATLADCNFRGSAIDFLARLAGLAALNSLQINPKRQAHCGKVI